MSDGPIRPRDSDVMQDNELDRLNIAIKDGLVGKPMNMLKDYTQDDLSRMRELGNRLVIERERKIMQVVLGSDSTDPIPPKQEPKYDSIKEGMNRKERRKQESEKRKAVKKMRKLGILK